MESQIDIVITWVDGSDPAWRAEKAFYEAQAGITAGSESQYRDLDTLRFVLRSIDQYAPWVRKIFLVTCGQIPPWLCTDHPKIVCVDHRDYIPPQYLPTFSSHTIELNFHRIADLSETFVYFNDDMFLTAPTGPEDFFADGLPCDAAVLSPIYATVPGHPFVHYLLNNMAVINGHFDIGAVVRAAPDKWFSPRYGRQLFKNMLYSVRKQAFCGFRNYHMPAPHLKSTFASLWELEPELLAQTCRNRFRSLQDVTPYLASYVNFCQNRFVPVSPRRGCYYDLQSDFDAILRAYRRRTYQMITINDHDALADDTSVKGQLQALLAAMYPQKSSFEK